MLEEKNIWKIWVRQLGSWHSQLNGKIKVMFQTTNQIFSKSKSPPLWHVCSTSLHLFPGIHPTDTDRTAVEAAPSCGGGGIALEARCQALQLELKFWIRWNWIIIGFWYWNSNLSMIWYATSYLSISNRRVLELLYFAIIGLWYSIKWLWITGYYNLQSLDYDTTLQGYRIVIILHHLSSSGNGSKPCTTGEHQNRW